MTLPPDLAAALALDGALAAWERDNTDDKILRVYQVGPAGATWRFTTRIEPQQRNAVVDSIVGRGVRIGSWDQTCKYVWVADHLGVTVWSDTGVVLESKGSVLQIGGATCGHGYFSRIESFMDLHVLGDCGVDLILRTDGSRVTVASYTPAGGPVDNFLVVWDERYMTSFWTAHLAGDIGLWLGIPHHDRNADPHGEHIRATRQVLLELAAQEPPQVRSLGEIEGIELELRVTEDGDTRELAIEVTSIEHLATTRRTVRRGVAAAFPTYLRSLEAPSDIWWAVNAIKKDHKAGASNDVTSFGRALCGTDVVVAGSAGDAAELTVFSTSDRGATPCATLAFQHPRTLDLEQLFARRGIRVGTHQGTHAWVGDGAGFDLWTAQKHERLDTHRRYPLWPDALLEDVEAWFGGPMKPLRELADRVSALPAGPFEEMLCEVGGGTLRVWASPLVATDRALDLRVYTPSRRSWGSRTLVFGSSVRIAGYLRRLRTLRVIEQIVPALLRELERDDYT